MPTLLEPTCENDLEALMVSQPLAPTSSSFQELWKTALDKYEAETGSKLLDLPSSTDLLDCNTVDDVIGAISMRDKSFKDYRSRGEKMRKMLEPVVSLVKTFLNTGAEGASAAGVPGGKAIFVGFGALLEASDQVSQVYDALEQLIPRLRSFLARIKVHFDSGASNVAALNDVFAETLVQLLHILALFTKYRDDSVSKESAARQTFRKLVKRTKDYGQVILGKKDVQRALEDFDRLTNKESLMTAASTHASVQSILNRDAEKAVRDWLDPPNPELNHDFQRGRKQEGTCDWFFDQRFEDWKSTSGGSYWIFGNPGSGKSVLCSSVISNLDFDKKGPLLYFYFDFRDSRKQTLNAMLSSFIFQLSAQHDKSKAVLHRFYNEQHSTHLNPTKDLLSTCLHRMLRACDDVTIVIDALDECPQPHRREELLPFLHHSMVTSDSPRMLFTSRAELDIQKSMNHVPGLTFLNLGAVAEHSNDVAQYIAQELSHPDFDGWSEHVKTFARQALNLKADGMFLWVNLQLQVLRQCVAADVEQTIDDLPNGLSGTYDRLIETLGSNPATVSRIRRIFECIAFSMRPLSPAELSDVLCSDFHLDGNVIFRPHLRETDPEAALLRLCRGFIHIVDRYDHETGGNFRVVQFIHTSARDYLLSGTNPDLRLQYSYAVDEISAHTTLASIALSTLESAATVPDVSISFDDYAVWHWHDHILLGSVANRVDKLLSRFLKAHSQSFLLWQRKRELSYDETAALMYWAAYTGLASYVESIFFEPDLCINAPGGPYGTALCAAAHNGHTSVIELLVEHGAAVEVGDEVGWTPLHMAAWSGHVEVVRLLLDHKAAVDMRINDGRTPLYTASYNGHIEVVRTLLDHKAAVDAPINDGATPLSVASQNGHIQVVRALLDHKAVVDTPRNDGTTPLFIASQNGHIQIVRALLDHKAAVDTPMNDGTTPLFIASQNDHIQIVRALLDHKAAVDTPMNDGPAPLFIASQKGHIQIVRALLNHKAAVDAPTNDGATPLFVASQNGHIQVVHALLDHKASVNAPRNDGATPLFIASNSGNVEVVRALLDHKAAVDAPTNDGATPLLVASQNGHIQVVRALLDHKAAVDAPINNGMTPLYLASQNGHIEVVRTLLDHKAAVDATSNDRITPLWTAAKNGHLEVIRALLNYEAKVNPFNWNGWTPLHVASRFGHTDVAHILLKSGADANALTSLEETVLYMVAFSGDVDMIRVLVQEYGARQDACTTTGCIPLHIAALRGNTAAVSFLLQSGADPSLRTNTHRTPLHYAASDGLEPIVHSLLAHQASLTSSDKCGFSALDYACAGGHADVVRLLLQRGAGLGVTSSLQGTFQEIADRALRADSIRPVTLTWRKGEAQDVMQVVEEWKVQRGGMVRGERRLRRVRSFWLWDNEGAIFVAGEIRERGGCQ